MAEELGDARGLSRRTVIKRAGIAGAAAWTAPAILTAERAFAAGTPGPGPTPGPCTGGRTSYTNDFQGSVGSEWSSSSVTAAPADSNRKFLGEFGNEGVTLTLTDLANHDFVTVSFDLYVLKSWDGNCGGGVGPDVFSVDVDGTNLTTTTFANNTGCADGQAYPGEYPGDSNPSRTGADEVDTLGYSFFGDSVYNLSYTVAHSDCDVVVSWAASGLQELSDESWGIDNVSLTLS